MSDRTRFLFEFNIVAQGRVLLCRACGWCVSTERTSFRHVAVWHARHEAEVGRAYIASGDAIQPIEKRYRLKPRPMAP